jgi:hypothetical protein
LRFEAARFSVIIATGWWPSALRAETRRLCAQHRGERRQPFANQSGLIVDDVVDWGAGLNSERRRRGRVIEMQE